MKSICIKTNNSQSINYLQELLEDTNLDNTFITIAKFKHFNNIIIHYKGNNIIYFLSSISNFVTKTILKYYEKNIILSNINLNYFYFDTFEKNQILENTIQLLSNINTYNKRYDIINNKIFEHLSSSHCVYLQSMIDFRLNDYNNFINYILDEGVNKFLIDKEYIEFVNMLRVYIKTESSQIDTVHLIYKNKNSLITDENNNIISCNDNLKKYKYASDISFSNNDYTLNTLLNLIPKKLIIHLLDEYCDEFINTLKLIFQSRVQICTDYNVCSLTNKDLYNL